MSLVLLIYLADVADKLSFTFCFISGALILPLVIFLCAGICNKMDDYEEEAKMFFKYAKISFLSVLFFAVLAIFTPSEKTIYIMAASHVTTVEDSKVNSYLNKVGKIIDGKLNMMIEEIEEK